MDDKYLVNFGDFPRDCGTIHVMRWSFICSEEKEDLFEVMNILFMSREVMILTRSAFISSMLFSNVVSGSNFVTSMLLFILLCSNLLSKDEGILEIYFSCTMNYYESLTDVSLITSVASERHSA